MFFEDEFEYSASNGKIYLISVEGEYIRDEFDGNSIQLEKFTFLDENDEEVTREDEVYAELREEATYHPYELEEHWTDTSFYGDHAENY